MVEVEGGGASISPNARSTQELVGSMWDRDRDASVIGFELAELTDGVSVDLDVCCVVQVCCLLVHGQPPY